MATYQSMKIALLLLVLSFSCQSNEVATPKTHADNSDKVQSQPNRGQIEEMMKRFDEMSFNQKPTPSAKKNSKTTRLISKAMKSRLEENMIWVEAGSFKMGSNLTTARQREQPAHTVELKGFLIGKTEVTQELWFEVMGWNTSYFPKKDQYICRHTPNNWKRGSAITASTMNKNRK